MGLAAFALVSQRWRRASLVHGTLEDYPRLQEVMTAEVLDARLAAINELIQTTYPQIWLDSYLFFLAILLVVFAAVLSISLQSTNQDKSKLWYPLLVLVGPATIACYTSRRRTLYYVKFHRFQTNLQTLLKEMTVSDASRHIKWFHRRPREDESPSDLLLEPPMSKYSIALIIQVVQIDPEDLAQQVDDVNLVLPSYHAAIEDVVLDVGVQDPQQRRHPSDERDLGDNASSPLSFPLPPQYDDAHAIEMTNIAGSSRADPPQYHA
ncbi:hypothetical protein BC940DRAFT_298610 [Gongronella butleri]|nr:hypothetical protein BC940DRAFT_298610 [Gongronella butleri]